LYFSPDVIRMGKSRRVEWTGHKKENACEVRKPEGKRCLGRPRRR
jgi:hypothetical protein